MLRYASTFRELGNVMLKYRSRGEKLIMDYARENCSLREAQYVEDMTRKMLDTFPEGSMCAIKLTSFGSRENPDKAYISADKIINDASDRGIKVLIDAEDVLYPNIVKGLMEDYNTKYTAHVYQTYQMYRRKALDELLYDIEDAYNKKYMLGAKLVRGAYLNKQRCLFHNKDEVDNEYNKALHYACVAPHVHSIVATHNKVSLRIVKKFERDRYYTANLMGMDEHRRVDYRYITYGGLLEVAPYLIRRLQERLSWS
jgi:proline dehydrogenase